MWNISYLYFVERRQFRGAILFPFAFVVDILGMSNNFHGVPWKRTRFNITQLLSLGALFSNESNWFFSLSLILYEKLSSGLLSFLPPFLLPSFIILFNCYQVGLNQVGGWELEWVWGTATWRGVGASMGEGGMEWPRWPGPKISAQWEEQWFVQEHRESQQNPSTGQWSSVWRSLTDTNFIK